MQCVVGNQLIQVDLPSGGTNGQVLTWNATASTAYRANPLTICCDQIIGCVQPLLDMIQNQINLIVQQLCPCTNGSGGVGFLDVYENGVEIMTTHNLNFLPCFTVAVNPVNHTMADVGINLAPTFECDIDEFGVISFTL